MYGYGSHIYLNEFIQLNKCNKIMEVGVYNGENALSMVQAAMKEPTDPQVEYYGFDFFQYYNVEDIDRKLLKTGCKCCLFKGNTLETLPEAVEKLPKMDIIFIDGGKSFNEAWSDWESSSRLMHKDTGVFIHNANFTGVAKMIKNIPKDEYDVKMFHPRFEGKTALVRKKQVSTLS